MKVNHFVPVHFKIIAIIGKKVKFGKISQTKQLSLNIPLLFEQSFISELERLFGKL